MQEKRTAMIDLLEKHSDEPYVLELQRLLICYQQANRDDRNVVRAALNKYSSQIDSI